MSANTNLTPVARVVRLCFWVVPLTRGVSPPVVLARVGSRALRGARRFVVLLAVVVLRRAVVAAVGVGAVCVVFVGGSIEEIIPLRSGCRAASPWVKKSDGRSDWSKKHIPKYARKKCSSS